MSDYRRYFVAGGSYFFTLVTHERRRIFSDPVARRLLGEAVRDCQRDWPFALDAVVLLPDHLHAIWTLPPGDARYSARWSRIKLTFTRNWLAAGGLEGTVSASARQERRRGIWQRRFWEHTIVDADDFDLRFDYIHYNPVRHGYARCPREWEPSTFGRWVAQGVYPADWACGTPCPRDFRSIEDKCGEPDS